jgi:hypothetical protein
MIDVKSKLDIIGGVGACLAGAGLVVVGYLSRASGSMEIGLAALTGGAIYLLFRTRITGSSNPSLVASRPRELILHIIFFSTFAASIWLMHSNMYRPIGYFVLTSISVAAVAANILSCNTKSQTWLLLLEILLISFSLRYGLLYELPSLLGADPWGHAWIIKAWLDQGHILAYYNPHDPSAYNGYAYFPFMHLIIMATQLVDSVSPKDSLFLSIGLIYIASTIFIFLLGKDLVNTKVGLLSALFVSICQFNISWGAWLIPTSLGIGILPMLLWLVLKNKLNSRYVLLLLIMAFTLILTHTLSSFITACVFVLILVAVGIFKWQNKTDTEKMYIGPSFVLLFCVSMLAWWSYIFYYPQRSFFESSTDWLFKALRTDIVYMGAAFAESATPLGPLNRVGFLILIGVLVIGILFWLSPKVINSKRVGIVGAILALAIVIFGLPLLNLKTLVTERWLAFIAVLGASVVADGIFALSRVFNGEVAKSMLMVFIVFAFSMFMINSYGVNTRTPFYGADYAANPYRYAFTDGEMRASETIIGVYEGQITTDGAYQIHPFWVALGLGRAGRVEPLSIEGENRGLIVLREYIYSQQVITGFSKERYDDFLATFSRPPYSMIYNNQSVKAYFR